jgi:hypothetical protein
MWTPPERRIMHLKDIVISLDNTVPEDQRAVDITGEHYTTLRAMGYDQSMEAWETQT